MRVKQAALEDTANLRSDSESESDKELDHKPKAINLCRDGQVARSHPSMMSDILLSDAEWEERRIYLLGVKPGTIKEREYLVSPAAGVPHCRPRNLSGVKSDAVNIRLQVDCIPEIIDLCSDTDEDCNGVPKAVAALNRTGGVVGSDATTLRKPSPSELHVLQCQKDALQMLKERCIML